MSSTPAEIRRTMTSALIEAGPVGQAKEIVDAIYEALEANDMLDLARVEPSDVGPDLLEEAISKMPLQQQTEIRDEIARIGKQAYAEKLIRAMVIRD